MGGFILIGEYFISFWAGSGYRVSYYVALLLMIPVTVPLIQSIGIEIQRAKNLHKFRSVVYLLLAVANLFISILLVKAYGEVGAAAGTGITLIIGNGFIMNWYYHKVVGLNIAFFWKEIIRIFPAILIAYLSGFLVKYAVGVDGIFKFLFVGLIYFIVFCCSMWYLGLNSYEKTLFSAPIKRLLHKK
jgi:O-antigen/teichoic acid export membrane protein